MYIALDIGGTNTRVALFKKGKLQKILKTNTKKDDFEEAIDEIDRLINELTTEKVLGIGISAPGPADYQIGTIGETPNLPGWKNKNLKKAIFEKTGISNIKMENDANLMALAHHFHFKNDGETTQFFTVSTGLGAGLIINDKVYTGHQGLAQEVATTPVAWKKESGKGLSDGSLELFASGSGIAFRASADTKTVFDERDINPTYKEIIDDGIETLANMIAATCTIIDPSLIVFDGPIARHHKWYVDEVVRLASTRTIKGQLDNIRIKFSELGDDAGLYGAYNLILNND